MTVAAEAQAWDAMSVFERFTDRSRRVLVLAQEESRLLNHGFIGTEHILLGLLSEGKGIASQALTQMDVSLDVARQKVVDVVEVIGTEPTRSPPFTPRAKKVLDLSLRGSWPRPRLHRHRAPPPRTGA